MVTRMEHCTDFVAEHLEGITRILDVVVVDVALGNLEMKLTQ